jgi:hypothetical protein
MEKKNVWRKKGFFIAIFVVVQMILSAFGIIIIAKADRGWVVETVDNSGNTGLIPSIAIDTTSKLHIAYVWMGNYESKIKWAKQDGTWVFDEIPESPAYMPGSGLSFVLDSNNKPHFSYTSFSGELRWDGNLRYAKKIGSSWTIESVPSTNYLIYQTSLDTDDNNFPHILYIRLTSPSNYDLYYVKKTYSGWQSHELVASSVSTYGCELEIDSSNNVHVIYLKNGSLKYRERTSSGWQDEVTLASCSIGGLALKPNNDPCVAYVNGGNLKYGYRSGGGWYLESTVIDTGVSYYNSPIAIDIDSDSNPHIGYSVPSTPAVRYAHKTSGSWTTETVISEQNEDESLVVDSNNQPHLAYYTLSGQDLRYGKLVPSYTLTMYACTHGTTSPTSPGTYPHNAGEEVTIEATAASGYHFAHWSGTYGESENPHIFNINKNYEETAIFERNTATITFHVDPNNGGIIDFGNPPEEIHDGDSITKPIGEYHLNGGPTSSHSFYKWKGTGNANIYNENEKETDVSIAGDCEITLGLSYYFTQITDVHFNKDTPERWNTVLQTMNQWNPPPKFVLCTGDLTDFGEDFMFYSGYDNFLYFTDTLNIQNGVFYIDSSHNIPIYFCGGNHDARGVNLFPQGFNHYHDFIGPDYNQIVNGNCVIFSLCSGADRILPGNFKVPWGDGLDNKYANEVSSFLNDVANVGDNYYKIVISHHPYVRRSGNDGIFYNYNINGNGNGNEGEFGTWCLDNNVDFLFSGHLHLSDGPLNTTGDDWQSGDGTVYIETDAICNTDAYRNTVIYPKWANRGDNFEIGDTQFFDSTISVTMDAQTFSSGYSNDGRQSLHDGITSDGQFEWQIPNSAYTTEQFVDPVHTYTSTTTSMIRDRTPDSPDYSFELIGSDAYQITVTLHQNLKNGFQSTAVYNDVDVRPGSHTILHADNSLPDYLLTTTFSDESYVETYPTTYEGNLPPEKPSTPIGPDYSILLPRINYEFHSSAIDPDYNDQVSFLYDWGDGCQDGWYGPVNSGEECIAEHIYLHIGTYNIICKAKDLQNVETEWSDPLTISMPFNDFGNTNLGLNSQNTENQIVGSNFMIPCEGTAYFINAYIQTATETFPKTKCMIYRADDCTLVGSTEEKILNTGGNGAWVTYNFTDPLQLTADTTYTIVCWGDSPYNIFYNNTSNNSFGRYKNLNYGRGNPPESISWDSNESRLYSIFCGYLTKPKIISSTASPNPIGFGYNTTITAEVESYDVSIEIINVNISYPNQTIKSFPMTQVDNDTFQYVFNNTWNVGQYNYSIWIVDEFGGNCTSKNYSFNISANAIISISTLRNSYSGTQYINITDPPNPPENYSLVGRGLTWNTYYNASSGENILETYQEPVNYQEDNGTWTPINNSFYQLASNHPAYVYGYRNGNDHGLYGVYFKSNAQNEWPIAFTYNRSDDPTIHVVRSKLVGVGYVDPQSNWAYQYLQSVQSSQGQTNDNSITYEDVFTGTDVTWSYGNTGLKEEITLSNTTKTVLQNHPPSMYGLNDTSSYLVIITKLDHQNLNLYNSSGLLDWNVTIFDAGVDFKDVLGQFKCALPLGEAYELNNDSSRQKLTYRIVHLNGNTYLLSGLKASKLNTMTFPVVIDPTLTVYSISSDGYIYNSGTNYNTVRTATTGTVNNAGAFITIGQKKQIGIPTSTYSVYRGFVFFNTSTLPSNAYLDNATLSIYKKDDYSTTDFDITIQNGQPTYPHNPLQSSDYNKNYYSGNGGILNTSRFTSGYNAIPLSNLNWVNKTGITKLCLRSSKDINGNIPTGSEYVNVHSSEFLGMCPPKLVIMYRNQSKIKNTGSTNIKGYLLIQVQFFENGKGVAPRWVVDNDTVNETSPRTINSGSQLGLDTIFNGHVRASNLTHSVGTYRVYAAFKDPEGNILKTNNGVELKAWWQFSKT